MDLPVGHAVLQQADDCPAIGQRLQFGRRAQVAEERPAFLDAAQRQDRAEQGALRQRFLARGQGTMLFHGALGVTT